MNHDLSYLRSEYARERMIEQFNRRETEAREKEAKRRKPMTDDEWCNWKEVVKCNWLKCAGGIGLAGNGCCSFRGDFDKADCSLFITDEDYEKKVAEDEQILSDSRQDDSVA